MALVSLFSCKEKVHYSVDETLNPYLQLFLQEASKHGYNFNVEADGLIMEFANLERPTIGLCTYSDPILVQIDPNYWSEVEVYENCEELRQNVVFHELAHGLLNRRHDNGTLPNSEWKSLMCGGDEVMDRSWQVNFHGERREYYLDELFHANTSAPAWSTYGAEFEGELGTNISRLDLTESRTKTDQYGNIFSVKNNVYTITLNVENNSIAILDSLNYINENFYYEAELSSNLAGNGDCVGIGVSYDDGNESQASNFFFITKNKTYNDYRAYVANTKCMQPIAEVILKRGVCNLTQSTKIAVERKDAELYFYVNDKLIYRNDYDADKSYNRLCIVAPSNNSVSIYSANCYRIGNNTSLRSKDMNNVMHSIGEIEYSFKFENFKISR